MVKKKVKMSKINLSTYLLSAIAIIAIIAVASLVLIFSNNNLNLIDDLTMTEDSAGEVGDLAGEAYRGAFGKTTVVNKKAPAYTVNLKTSESNEFKRSLIKAINEGENLNFAIGENGIIVKVGGIQYAIGENGIHIVVE